MKCQRQNEFITHQSSLIISLCSSVLVLSDLGVKTNRGSDMGEPSRRDKIEAMLADEPGDPFLRYALAAEMDKEGDHDRSLALLAELRRDDPPYGPAYFLAGQQLARLGRIEEARAVLRDGIDHARRSGDAHAAAEMSEFLASLGALGE